LKDKRIVLTLDAGGTNFVFSAMCGGKPIVAPYRLPALTETLEDCLNQLVEGFNHIKSQCEQPCAAISFAFPGPADYVHGVIGDLPNFKCFRGGVALGPFLEKQFGVPVFINNDGWLFAYGEAMAGALPTVNQWMEKHGNTIRYHNLIGITLGTGFGCGIVINETLLLGDNGQASNMWCFRNKKYTHWTAEESVSIRAVQRVYRELSNDDRPLSPKDIADIAHGIAEGDQISARRSFAELGEIAGDSIATACDLIDGIVVIGGGIAHSADLIFPSLVKEMNTQLKIHSNCLVNRLPSKAFNLEDENSRREFLREDLKTVQVEGTTLMVPYLQMGHIGIMRSCLAFLRPPVIC